MRYKSCSKCGKIHPRNYNCTVGKVYTAIGDERELRSSYAWTVKSKEIREKAHHLCEVCLARGIFTYNNLEVHHIVKVREDKEKFLDDFNLICLCQEHHKQADENSVGGRGGLTPEYLMELARQRECGY